MQPKPVRSFARGLQILEALNRHGSATALALARHTDVPRGAVYRLLQTLQEAGYVERSAGDDSFCLKAKVRQLAGWVVSRITGVAAYGGPLAADQP